MKYNILVSEIGQTEQLQGHFLTAVQPQSISLQSANTYNIFEYSQS